MTLMCSSKEKQKKTDRVLNLSPQALMQFIQDVS